MKSFSIQGSKRTDTGKAVTKRLRASGQVPCVLYGGPEHIHFSVPTEQFKGLIYTPEAFTVKLNLDGKEHTATFRDAQYHPVSDKILHVDFQEYLSGNPVVMSVPVKISGSAEGVKAGGQLLTKMRRITLKAKAEHLPDAVELNIDKLKIGDAIRVGDLKFANVEVLDNPKNVITAVKTARTVVEEVPVVAAAAEAAPAAGAAAPAAGAAPDAKAAAPAKK